MATGNIINHRGSQIRTNKFVTIPAHQRFKLFLQETKDKMEEMKRLSTLFKGLKFFLGREIPRENLVFMIRAFGGNDTFIFMKNSGDPKTECVRFSNGRSWSGFCMV